MLNVILIYDKKNKKGIGTIKKKEQNRKLTLRKVSIGQLLHLISSTFGYVDFQYYKGIVNKSLYSHRQKHI